MKLKFCKKCQAETERYTSGKCKPCQAAAYARWQEKNPEKAAASRKAAVAKWQAANPEKAREAVARWQAANPEYAKEYYLNNPEKVRASVAKYQKTNPEKVRASVAKYQKANPEKVRAAAAKWRANNPEKTIAESVLAKYRADNLEKLAAYSAEWQKNNPEKVAAAAKWRAEPKTRRVIYRKKTRSEIASIKKWQYVANRQNRRARVLNAGGTHTAKDIRLIATYQKRLCACCTVSIEGGYHVDHIKALSRGGSNDRQNLQMLCATCNLQKHARHPIEFMQKFFPERLKSWAAALLRRREVLGF